MALLTDEVVAAMLSHGYLYVSDNSEHTVGLLYSSDKLLSAEVSKDPEGNWVCRLIYLARDFLEVRTPAFDVFSPRFEDMYEAELLLAKRILEKG